MAEIFFRGFEDFEFQCIYIKVRNLFDKESISHLAVFQFYLLGL